MQKTPVYPFLVLPLAITLIFCISCSQKKSPNHRENLGLKGKVKTITEVWKDTSGKPLSIQNYFFSKDGELEKMNFRMPGIHNVTHLFKYDKEGYLSKVYQKDSTGALVDSIRYDKTEKGDTIILTNKLTDAQDAGESIQYKLYFLKGLLAQQTQFNSANNFFAKLLFEYDDKNWLLSTQTIYMQDTAMARFLYKQEDAKGNWIVRETLDDNTPGIKQLQTREITYY